ncbi:MAG: sulfite exporter TauE/SafE family protein [Salinivirgaceae bacterium]
MIVPELNAWLIALTLVAGFAAGFINTLAGSGSAISLPLLMFLGLPANVANGTNRLMILLSGLVGVASFRQQKVFSFRDNLRITLPSIAGAIIGALMAVSVNEQAMTRIIGVLMIVMFFMVIYKPEKWVKASNPDHKHHFTWWQHLLMFGIGFYGGFIQLGVGVFLLAGLVLGAGYDLLKANALKILIIIVYTVVILPIFFWNQQIDFVIGLVLAAGSMLGAFVASRFAVSWGPGFVRYILLAVILFSAIKFLGIYDFFMELIKA